MPIQAGQPIKASEVNAAFDAKENLSNKVTSISSVSTDTQYPSAKAVYAHTSRTDNPHAVTAAQVGARPASWTPGKADIGLGNADNTSDASKPISTAVQTALTAVQTTLSNLSFFPKGTILTFSTAAWNATSAVFKDIWKICNGQNGTPNLVNKFLRGAENSNFAGGSDTANIRLEVKHLPAHSHSIRDPGHKHTVTAPDHSTGAGYLGEQANQPGSTLYTGSSTTGISINNTGGGEAYTINIVPSYYTVMYIMKVV